MVAVVAVVTSRASIVEASEGVVGSGVIVVIVVVKVEVIVGVVASVATVGAKVVIVGVGEAHREVSVDVGIVGVVTLPLSKFRPRFALISQDLVRAQLAAVVVLGGSCFPMIVKRLSFCYCASDLAKAWPALHLG